MTVPSWPSELSQRLQTGSFSTSPRDGRLRTAPETGPKLTRRRTSANSKPVSGQFECGFDGLGRLERFWDETLAGGVLPFSFPTQTLDNLSLLTADGQQLLTEADAPILITSYDLVVFSEKYQVAPVGGRWFRVSINLEVMP